MVRNLDYVVNIERDAKPPVFDVTRKADYVLEVAVPGWLKVRDVKDFVTGKKLRVKWKNKRVLKIEIGDLDAFCVVWLENSVK